MNKILHIVQHIAFIIFALLFLNLFIFSGISFETAKGKYRTDFSISDTTSSFKESSAFNEMLGTSVLDVIKYCGTLEQLDSPSYKESVSGNNILSVNNNDLYSDSSRYADFLSGKNSNIRFFMTIKKSDGYVCHTNMEDAKSITDETKLKNILLSNCDKYIFLDAANHIYDTNTLVEETTVYKLFDSSSYVYPKTTTIMVGVLNDLSLVKDGYHDAKVLFDMFAGNYVFKLILMIVSVFIYLALLIVLTISEGVVINRQTKERRMRTYQVDKISFEIRVLALIGLFGLCVGIMYANTENEISMYITNLLINRPISAILLIACILLIISLIFNFFYYGMVRRIKSGLIITTGICYRLIKKICRFSTDVYDNWTITFRVYLPYILVALTNALLGIVIASPAEKIIVPVKIIISVAIIILDIITVNILYRNTKERMSIINAINAICNGDLKSNLDESLYHGDNAEFAKAVNHIGNSVKEAVKTSMKDEKMKADLITNVSHDLKTPLTSIITYVDLLKKESIDNEKAKSYIQILDEKSQRLKLLTDDLVEASKISSGNIVLSVERINLKELINQITAEFYDKFAEKKLSFIGTAPDEDIFAQLDSRSIYRVLDNIFTNIYKYALEGTRVYIDITSDLINEKKKAVISIKNISANSLNISSQELLERFVRGDESRTTEGSGLGLSIAKNLTEAMGGRFEIVLDGDLFKTVLIFDITE